MLPISVSTLSLLHNSLTTSLAFLEYVIVKDFSNIVSKLNKRNLDNLLICDIVGDNLCEKFNFSISESKIIPQSNLKLGAFSCVQLTTKRLSKISILLLASTILTQSKCKGKLFNFNTAGMWEYIS